MAWYSPHKRLPLLLRGATHRLRRCCVCACSILHPRRPAHLSSPSGDSKRRPLGAKRAIAGLRGLVKGGRLWKATAVIANILFIATVVGAWIWPSTIARTNYPPTIRIASDGYATLGCFPRKGVYGAPPTLRIQAVDELPLRRDAVTVAFGRMVHQDDSSGVSLRILGTGHASWTSQNSGRALIGRLDTRPLLGSAYPHGLYLVQARVTDSDGAVAHSALFNLNYGYYTRFAPLASVLQVNANGAFRAEEGGGLQIVNDSRSGGFVSATLRQAFLFKTDFLIAGRFLLESPSRRPVGLEVNLGTKVADRYLERVAFIFPDGRRGLCCIKTFGEKRSDPGVTNLGSPKRFSIKTDGKSLHYFLIVVRYQSRRFSRYDLYLNTRELDLQMDNPSHSRLLHNGLLGKGPTWVEIRLWKRGKAILQHMSIAEIPRGRA